MTNKRVIGTCIGIGVLCAAGAGAQVIAGLANGATGTTSSAVTVVSANATQVSNVVKSTTTAAVTAVAASAQAVIAPAVVVDKLPPLNLTNMRLWNWSGNWHASEWDNTESPIPWRYNHVKQPTGTDTIFTLDAAGSPQLQAEGGIPSYSKGLWETEVTLPKLRDGLIVAPLWLYDPASKDEIDFEFVGKKGLDVTLHAYVGGVHKSSAVRLFAGQDMSGRRKRFGIKVDQTAGYVEMYVDGMRVYSWNRSSMAFFVSHPVKPWIEMWASKPTNTGYVQWAGKWTGLAAGEALAMTVHGYRYSTIK